MALDRKSLGAWASAATETLLRADRGLVALPDDDHVAHESVDPHGTPCRYYVPGHKPHHMSAMRAGELRRAGAAEGVRYVGHALVPASSLFWDDDAVPGSDPTRLVARLDLQRADGTSFSLVTHDTRGIAAIEACGGLGLWLVSSHSVLLVPSWDDDARAATGRDGEPTSWPTLSVAEIDEPWLPCPVASPKHARGRTGAET